MSNNNTYTTSNTSDLKSVRNSKLTDLD